MYVLNWKLKPEREEKKKKKKDREKMLGVKNHWKFVFLEEQPMGKFSLMLSFDIQYILNLDPNILGNIPFNVYLHTSSE